MTREVFRSKPTADVVMRLSGEFRTLKQTYGGAFFLQQLTAFSHLLVLQECSITDV